MPGHNLLPYYIKKLEKQRIRAHIAHNLLQRNSQSTWFNCVPIKGTRKLEE